MATDPITQHLTSVATAMGVKFSLRDKPVTYAEVFSETGLLPAISKRADQLCSLCLGYGIGVSFEQAEGSLTGVRVKFDEATPSTLRYLCIIDVISEIIKMAKNKELVPLDELLYD